MTAIDDLLAQSLLLTDPHVPSDVIPYEDTAYPALAPDGAPLWDGSGRDLADGSAAQKLQALCEAALLHCTADQLADFLTDQVPQPRAAWILGCALQLADDDIGARFWWQYAAGADDLAASYSLYLHHLARGDTYAASFWHTQACAGLGEGVADDNRADDVPACQLMSADTSIPTVLRVLSRLARAFPREHTQTATAVIDFVSTAVATGYDRNPGYELPLPGPGFAEYLEIIVAATSATRCLARTGTLQAGELPNRRPVEAADDRFLVQERAQEPERLLVEVVAGNDESVSAFFRAAVAVCWETVTAARTGGTADEAGVRLRYYLDRRRLPDRHHRTPRTRTAQPSR
jgi:Family of unknown function (DUF6207)